MHSAARIHTLAGLILIGVGASPSWGQGTDAACGAANVTGGDSTAPCFSDVTDILGGQRYLLRTDDLMVTIGFRDSDTTTVKNLPLLTDQLKPNPQSQQEVNATGCDVRGTINEQTPLFMRLGRIYNLKYEVVVNSLRTIPISNGDCGQAFQVSDPTTGDILDLIGTSESSLPRMALLDADLDGYDDVFSMTSDNMQFHSPQDVDTPSSEMIFRAIYSSTTAGHAFSPRADPVSGDFNGDGAVDIAWVAADAGETVLIRVVSVCPAEGQVVLGTTCAQGFEIVPWAGTIDTGQTWVAPSGTVLPGFALAAGDLDGTPQPGTNVTKDELVLIIRENFSASDPAMVAKAYSFADDAWSETGNLVLPGSTAFNGLNVPLYVASGRLDWSQRKEQVVFAASGFQSVSGIWVLYLDEELTLKVGQRVETSGITNGIVGVAMGRFDPPDASSSPTGTPELDFNQQIAVLYSAPWCGDAADCKADMVLQIFKTDNPTFTPELQRLVGTTVPSPDAHFSFELLSSPLQAGDLQGRSLLLGPPEKATVTQTQIDTVLGMPPMHVDYITPPQASEPEVYNVSVFPEVFSTAYQFTDSTNSAATSKSTTSYTYATKESAQEKISYGVPDVGGISVSAKQAATQKHKSTVASVYDTYAGSSYNLNAATVFDDIVGFATKRMNIYSYPVIGHTVCPESAPDCADDAKLPLHVQFSGVDNVVTYKAPVSAGVLEWYQAVNQPGALFSYPGNLAQLEADQPQQQAQGSDTTTSRLMLLSTPTEWSTSDDDTVALSWSQGSSGTNT
ncbi:MAG: VCBS repeat-containing protein, partial [Pseudomonadota bacterium]